MSKPQQGPEKKLGDLLSAFLVKSGITRQFGPSSLQLIWKQTVGEPVAGHTRATSLRGGVLRVEVDSAPWLHDLKSFHQEELVQELQARLEGRTVRRIEFRIGDFHQDAGPQDPSR